MLDALKFVRGAVSTKDFAPEMKHFRIENGSVCSFNGIIALSTPIPIDLTCAPKAVPMVKAITTSTDIVALSLTDANRLRVQSSGFRAYIDCVDMADLPTVAPEGDIIAIDGEGLLEALGVLLPFIGNDASRPWTNGVLLRGQSAFATNNVCLVEYWVGGESPFTANIPMAAVKEMLRIAEPPSHVQVCPNSITFHYEGDRWLRTALYSVDDWPNLRGILETPGNPTPVPEGLFEGLESIKPFAEKIDNVYFRDGFLCTHQQDGVGATYEVAGLHSEGIYRLPMLMKLNGVADNVDFTLYPKPIVFTGSRLRGALVGLRQ